MVRFLVRPPTKFKHFSYRNDAVFSPSKSKSNINRDLQSLNPLRYFHGGHMSNDIIIMAIVKP